MLPVSKKRYTFATKQLTIISRKTQLREKNSKKINKKKKEEMKKILIMLAVLFMASTVSVNAQDDKAKAKAEAKAKKKKEKKDKDAQKDKDAIVAYGEFMKTYEPLKATGIADVDALVSGINGICASLNVIYEKVGYVEIETEEVDDEGEIVQVCKRIYNRNTGEDIEPGEVKQNFKDANTEILPLVASATNLGLGIASLTSNPQNLIALGPQVKPVIKQGKLIVKVVPAIKKQIEKNNDILKRLK